MMNGTDDQRERELERLAEKRRRLSAGLVAVVAIVVSSFVVVHLAFGGRDGTSPVLQPVLALMMSLALVSGFRSLDGPFGGTSGRRGSRGASDASAGLTLWLACFAAIWGTLFLSSISSEMAERVRTAVVDRPVRTDGNVTPISKAAEARGGTTQPAAGTPGSKGRDVR